MGKKYALFGAGYVGQNLLQHIKHDMVAFFIDNNTEKEGTFIEGIPVRSFLSVKDELSKYNVIISVSEQYICEIESQLKSCSIPYDTFQNIKLEAVKEKIMSRPDYLGTYRKAVQWIKKNSIDGKCIINNTLLPKGYPEVTGYYIPTLLRWGYRELAASFGAWLLDIQKNDGSWYDTDDTDPYVFDSAQILKGLVAIKRSIRETGLPFVYTEAELDERIQKGIDWIFSNMREDGRLITPSETEWGEKRICSEVIHLYCLQPIAEAAEVYNRPDYQEKVQKILAYYKEQYMDDILNFGLLSHFYSYVIEALVDLGDIDLARKAMKTTEKLMDKIGFVPAYRDVHWCCSTGLFQQAIIWYKLGDVEHGDKAFKYACKLQNSSGGWYGSYVNPKYPDEKNDYFPDGEISWAVKYFLDAVYFKNKAEFNSQASDFIQEYAQTDGRYELVKNEIDGVVRRGGVSVLDVGCGKGAYIHNLLMDVSGAKYTAVDISTKVMSFIKDTAVERKEGSLTEIPYPDDTFDFTYTTEALEHAVDIESAVRELCRVTRPGGEVLILDKNIEKIGALEIGEWEQWFDVEKLRDELGKHCSEIRVNENVGYNGKADGLFCVWIGKVK